MALIKCKECGTEVSNKAATCVKCGAPVSKQTDAEKMAGGIGAAVIIGGIIWACVHFIGGPADSGSGNKPQQTQETPSCAKDDLQCLGDKGIVGAGVYCKDPVERLAEHDVKWTDGTFETKFSRFRWADKPNGVITYIGDKAQFQNGFGAYTNVIYECDLASDDKTVLDARVSEGRLPQ